MQEFLIRRLEEEIRQLRKDVDVLRDGVLVVYGHPPERPRNGFYYANGAPGWNPGSGRGLYRYDETTGFYTFLG